ncbi:MAG: hypothetical protein ACYC61_00815 [Isosphaeraceae bacterium]
MAELWLVCEGEPGSVDVALLKTILTDVLAAEIVVEPACGSNLGPVARFLETRRGGRAAYVHDRDYRPRNVVEATYTDGRRGFAWRRHCIENYLLPPPIILRAFLELRASFEWQGHLPAWLTALPATPDEIAAALTESARGRAAEEACRRANQELWAGLPSEVGHVQQRSFTAPGASGPDDWREALCQEAERVSQAAALTAGCTHFHRDHVRALFDAAYAQTSAEGYLTTLEFLIDFHGKDLLGAFHQSLCSRKIPLSRDRLCQALIPAAARQYADDRTTYGTDDFLHLANGVRALAGLPPLA